MTGIPEKALRYIADRRVRVVRCEPGTAAVAVRGSRAEPYHVTLRRGGWSCDCPAPGLCSHVYAACLVVDPDASFLSTGGPPAPVVGKKPLRELAEGEDFRFAHEPEDRVRRFVGREHVKRGSYRITMEVLTGSRWERVGHYAHGAEQVVLVADPETVGAPR